MARLVQAKCPSCGAGMRVNPGDEVVTCGYCRVSSFVQTPKRHAQNTRTVQAYTHTIQLSNADLAKGARGAGAIVAVVIGLTGVMVLGISGAVFWLLAATPSVPSAPRRASRRTSGLPIKIGNSKLKRDVKSLRSQDEATRIIRITGKMARKMHPKAQLKSARFADFHDGKVHLSESGAGSLMFGFRGLDPDAPPGKDERKGMVMISIRNNQAYAMNAPTNPPGPPLRTPKCSSSRVWSVVQKAGVPETVHATLMLRANKVFGKTLDDGRWTFTVKGHPKYRHEVDAQSCRLIR